MASEGFPPLEDHEPELIVKSFLRTRPKTGATEDEILRVINWARERRAGEIVLDMILEGEMDVGILGDGSIGF